MMPTEEELSQCLASLNRAFADCAKPVLPEQLISVGGIDAPDAMSAWGKLDRADLAGLGEFDFRLGEYLDLLSSDAIRHFLPPLLSLALCRPEVMDDSGLFYLTRRLEAMILKDPTHKYYRGATLTKSQRDALCLWADLMQRVPDPLGIVGTTDEFLLHERTESLALIARIREGLATAEPRIDFDLDYQSGLAEEAKKASGGPLSRRRGWQRHKRKDGPSRKKRGCDHAEYTTTGPVLPPWTRRSFATAFFTASAAAKASSIVVRQEKPKRRLLFALASEKPIAFCT
jgi:hypothetical protein